MLSIFLRWVIWFSIGIPREDRAKTDSKWLYAKLNAKPQPEHHQLLTRYGVLVNLYQTEDLQPATDLMGSGDDIPDTPEARQTTLTLANDAHQASTTTRVSVSCTCKKTPAQIVVADALKMTSNAPSPHQSVN